MSCEDRNYTRTSTYKSAIEITAGNTFRAAAIETFKHVLFIFENSAMSLYDFNYYRSINDRLLLDLYLCFVNMQPYEKKEMTVIDFLISYIFWGCRAL